MNVVLLNQFAEKKGFDYVKERLEIPELDAPVCMISVFAL